MGKVEIARNKQFFLFPNSFQLNQINVSFVHIFDNISLFAIELEESKSGISGKGLKMDIRYKIQPLAALTHYMRI